MCGITGAISLANQGQILTENGIKNMISVMKHRGPDDSGIYIGDGVAFGMCRLSIIDIKSGHQPISNEDRRIHIICNGEIYNHDDIRHLLEKKGHFFRTHTDVETILHLYEEYGEKCVEYLNGMFAFAIWDENERKLFLARDRIGIKPLYYGTYNNIFIFGSEIKSIIAFPDFPRRLNYKIISAYLSLQYIPCPFSIFENIYKLPPAHILVIKNGNMHIKRYWKLPDSTEKDIRFTDKEYIEEIIEHLSLSIRKRLMSEVPIGAFLSGGVDSSTVVSLISRNIRDPVKTFTIDFMGGAKKYSEVVFARRVAQHFKTEHHEQQVNSFDLVNLLQKLAWHFDEPFADSSMVPAFVISKLAREYITVALSGDGGDELFGGYDIYKYNRLFEYFLKMPRFVALKIAPWISEKLAKSLLFKDKIWSYRLRRFNKLLPLQVPERHAALMTFFQHNLLSDILDTKNEDEENWDVYRNIYEPIWNETFDEDIWNSIFKLDIQNYLPEDILVKVDRTSMANSLEVRVPMLDHEMVEFACRIPANKKLRWLQTKYILKRTASTLVPPSVIYRKKQGFSVPINEWLRGDLHDFCHDLLLGNSRHCSGIFRKTAIENILQKHDRHERNLGHHIWALMIFELWYNTFM